jgi:demethylmenaquinone methyltransferase/2-methoxy-6-polyprenyl-1,4-benzoquinol methylase
MSGKAHHNKQDAYSNRLYLADVLREPVIRAAIQALDLPPGSRGLDVGCGIGSHTLLLAEAVSPGGHVTGLDISAGLTALARQAAERSPFREDVSFQVGDMRRIPYRQDTFDWCWSVDCAGYAPGEPVPLVGELIRVVKPRGVVLIMAWSSEQLLPGYPRLEARLGATRAGIAPFVDGNPPAAHFLRALGWFSELGITQPMALTFVGSVQSPLNGDHRAALVDLFQMRWSGAEVELDEQDLELYRRLCRPDSGELILDHPGYYAFFTYTLFHGRAP